jgi:hypothetical protein
MDCGVKLLILAHRDASPLECAAGGGLLRAGRGMCGDYRRAGHNGPYPDGQARAAQMILPSRVETKDGRAGQPVHYWIVPV